MLLLNPYNNLFLVKTLYGILMILPQGKAFGALNKRIKNIEILIMMESKSNLKHNDSRISKDSSKIELSKEEIEEYVRIFQRINEIKES